MFTGIVKFKAKLTRMKFLKNDMSFWIDLSKIKNLKVGDSIAINGVCLTVSKLMNTKAKFELMHETINKTNFKYLKNQDEVNIEDSLRLEDKLDGHLVYGDVDCTGEIIKINKIGHGKVYTINFPKKFSYFVVNKGRIALDGMSLTVNNSTKNTFDISIINHTKKITNISNRKIGDIVNLEFDIYLKGISKMKGKINENKCC